MPPPWPPPLGAALGSFVLGAPSPSQARARHRAAAHVGKVEAAAGGDVVLEADEVVDPTVVLVQHGLPSPASGEAARRTHGRREAADLRAERRRESRRLSPVGSCCGVALRLCACRGGALGVPRWAVGSGPCGGRAG